jgi:hypothetical protein
MLMVTANEYRELALEFFRSADEAETEEMRDAFLKMARDWMTAALRSGGSSASTCGHPIVTTTRQ